MNEANIIKLLWDTGHVTRPFGENERAVPELGYLSTLGLNNQLLRDAIESYQQMHSAVLEPIAAEIWPLASSPKIQSGVVDKPTDVLLKTARCACPDYQSLQVESAGTGNWKGCYGIGNFHHAHAKLLNEPPDFLKPYFPQIWQRVQAAYSELGLLLTIVDVDEFANIDISFQNLGGSTIGLAILGYNQGCNSNLWAKFSPSYKPANIISEWTTLLKHELGHTDGLDHSSGGVMNPYILPNLPVSWKGDPSYQLLVQRHGGQPVPTTPTSPPTGWSLVLAKQYTDGSFEVIRTIDDPGDTVWPV